jgi:hypothetical protein
MDVINQEFESRRVLVIEYDDLAREHMCQVLEEAGFQVSSAELPDIGIIRRTRAEAIVVGLFYRGDPGGLSFLEQTASDQVLNAVPVVIVGRSEQLSAGDQRRLSALRHPVIEPGDDSALLDRVKLVLPRIAAPV